MLATMALQMTGRPESQEPKSLSSLAAPSNPDASD
jgi:hypothetical protein